MLQKKDNSSNKPEVKGNELNGQDMQGYEYYFNKLNPIKLYRKRKEMQLKRSLAK
jgi:hypothetical protein